MIEYEGIHVITKSLPDAQACCEVKWRRVSSRSVLDVKSKRCAKSMNVKMCEVQMEESCSK